MTSTQQLIQDIQTRWWKLVQQRMDHYNLALSEGVQRRPRALQSLVTMSAARVNALEESI